MECGCLCLIATKSIISIGKKSQTQRGSIDGRDVFLFIIGGYLSPFLFHKEEYYHIIYIIINLKYSKVRKKN